jgi:transposase
MLTSESKPIVERIEKLLQKWGATGRFTPRTLMGQAIRYTLQLMPYLKVYLDHGHLRIDNNLVENAIRPTAVGKKNWMFIGDADAGDVSAVLYTIIEACRGRGIDPWNYLKDGLTKLPTLKTSDIKDVTPEAWARARSPKQQAEYRCRQAAAETRKTA